MLVKQLNSCARIFSRCMMERNHVFIRDASVDSTKQIHDRRASQLRGVFVVYTYGGKRIKF